MNFELKQLKEIFNLSIIKEEKDNRTSSIAYSKSGESYRGANVSSDTNLLHISSEQVALMRAVQNNDFGIEKVVTMPEKLDVNEIVSPIILKLLIDFVRRTGQKLAYTVIDKNGNMLFNTDDVSSLFSFYKPERTFLKKIISNTEVQSNKAVFENNSSDTKTALKKYALLGIDRGLPRYDSASGYGTAVLTKSGTIYFSGQYSSFDKRMNVHSEMAAVISALMEKDTEITHMGLVSTKYKDEPAHMCGCCRQFMSEMINKFDMNVEFFLFAKNTDSYEKRNISDYLPESWSSKNW